MYTSRTIKQTHLKKKLNSMLQQESVGFENAAHVACIRPNVFDCVRIQGFAGNEKPGVDLERMVKIAAVPLHSQYIQSVLCLFENVSSHLEIFLAKTKYIT